MCLYPQHPTSQMALKPSEIISEALLSGELTPEDVNVELSDVAVEDEVTVDVEDQLDRHSTTSTTSSSSSTGDDDGNLNKEEKEKGKDDNDNDGDDDDRSESEFVNENLDYTGPEMVRVILHIVLYIDY